MRLGDSTPALVGDRLYVFTRQGDEEVILSLDAASGKMLWQKDPFHEVVPQFFTAMSPIIVDGMAITHLFIGISFLRLH